MWRFGICAGEDTRINRYMIHFGRCRTDVHKDVMPRQGARGLLMDGTAVESAFALLLTKVTKPENVEIYRWEMKKCRER